MQPNIPPLSPEEQDLLDAAWEARKGAVCGFSGFGVGAVLVDDRGFRYDGANVENASYNLGLCAERVALFHALTHGASAFTRVVIVTEAASPTSPCGACRQALWEFAPQAELLIANRDAHQRMTMADLLPHAFDASALDLASKPPAR